MTEPEVAKITIGEFDHAELQDWLGKTSPELFREYLNPSIKIRRDLLSDRFQTLFAKAESEVRLCKWGQDYRAIIGFERLDWDSDHFGVECGRISPYCISSGLSCAEQLEIHKLMLGLGIEWAGRNGIKVLQRRLLSGRFHEINVLESMGFHLIDNVVTLIAPVKNILSATRKQGNNLVFRSPVRSELDTLLAMTRGAFPYSRFINDRVLSADLGNDLYLKWLARLFEDVGEDITTGASNQGMIVAILKDRIAGYVAYRIDRTSVQVFGKCIASIELIVVDPAFQGKGIGQNLFREVSRVLNDSGVDLLESSTWINQRLAMASNQKAGLRVCENLFTYHLHL